MGLVLKGVKTTLILFVLNIPALKDGVSDYYYED